MDKKIEVSMLLDLYKGLLTDKQAETMELYYNEDLSLSEIAENLGITRQGVRDALVKGEKALLEAEEKLGLGKRIENLESRLKKINGLIKMSGTAEEIIKLSEIGE
jgi:predicted DNA-binding protein YlxM (UPF0122 family)